MQNSPRVQSKSKTSTTVGNGFPQVSPLDFDALFEMQRPALNAMVEFNTKWIEGLTNFNEEWVGFVNTRLKEDLGVCKELAACKSAQDVYGVYNEFYQTALKHYQGEAEKISQMGKTIADDTIHSVQDQIDDISNGKRRAA